MSYSPREGSIAHRAIEHLRANGPMFSAPLAEAIGVSAHSLSACLEHPVAQGALLRERREHLFWWSLGSGRPLVREKDVPLTDGVPIDQVLAGKARVNRLVQAVAAPSTPGVSTKAAEDIQKFIRAASPDSGSDAAPAGLWPKEPSTQHENPHAAFRCALWSDGRLAIELDEEPMLLLSVEQTRELVRYLDRLAPEVAS